MVMVMNLWIGLSLKFTLVSTAMKTICCLLVAVIAATCTALTDRQLELQQFLRQAHADQQLEGILQQMMIQYGNELPKEIVEVLTLSNLPMPSPVVVPAAPEKSKYQFEGMEKLSANELRAVNVFLDEYFTKRDEEFVKFQPRKMNIRTPRQCKLRFLFSILYFPNYDI